ncbi:MAG: sialidase family protein [Armatimonadota bacterium]
MADIQVLDTGLIYRNPKPHVRAIHAIFPSVVALNDGEMLASLALAEAFEAVDMHSHLARSADGGATWELQGELYRRRELTSDSARIMVAPDGEIVALVNECDRSDHPDDGLANPDNLGFVPTQFWLLRSRDGGRTWSPPRPIDPPLIGPSFELCSPIVPLSDGRWLLPTSTWRGWDGSEPSGMKMVAFISEDNGETWPQHADVMSDPAGAIIYWESKIAQMADGTLLAVAWAYDEEAGEDLPNQYALSDDGGLTWSAPTSTGLQGQTMDVLALDDDRVLAIYRRMDRAGLWAALVSLEGGQWETLHQSPVWGAEVEGLTGSSDDMVGNFNVLRFGAPCVIGLPDGGIFVAFWCYEECVSNIRWFRLAVE